MLSFLLYIFVLCFSLVSWVLLTFTGYSLLRYRHRSPKLFLSGIIMAALWIVTTFNVWYEGLVLIERISFLPSVNSWAFVLITPLFYLYYRLLLTGRMPDRRAWTMHLFLPGVLALAYLCLTLSSSVPDKFVYSWQEFLPQWRTWWGIFRISCYLVLAGQLAVYLPRLFRKSDADGRAKREVLKVRREMLMVIAFCAVSLLCMFTPQHVFRFLYFLFIALLAYYFLAISPYYRLLRMRVASYLIPITVKRQLPQEIAAEEQEPYVVLSTEKEEQLERVLRSNLHEPYLTIGWLARELCTNKTYLSRYFNRQRGVTFPEYVTSCRLDEAEKLLLETSATVIEVAEQVGFQTLSAFYAAFTARHSMPPAQWRKR